MFIYLPSGAHSEKVGVDDFLVAGHSIDDLLALATTELRRLDENVDYNDGPYRITDDGIIWMKQTREGPVEVPLTNFRAAIVADITEDDGAEERRSFEIEAVHRGRSTQFKIPAAQFAGMTWATEQLGATATCYPGMSIRDHARFAIQSCSGDVPSQRVYAHTGWRQVDGDWMFLLSDGAIGSAGHTESVETRLSGALSRYNLPCPPGDEDLIAAVRASVGLLEIGNPSITVPLVGAVYLAPLCHLLAADRPDFVPWFHGPSGAFKSELAALAQSHFGRFSRQTLPASFTDTANALERILFSAKDMLVVVDDFHPANDRREEQTMGANASRLLRGVGNGNGRQRMRADTSLRPDLPPRALAIATGERLPSGHSTAARMFPVPIARGDVSSDQLAAAQRQIALYAQSMAGYVQWLATRFSELEASLHLRFEKLRAQARSGGHPRDAAQVAHLQVGIETVLQFATEVGAVDDERAGTIRAEAWAALTTLSQNHQDDLADESPVQIFLALLADGFASRRVYVDSLAGEGPLTPGRWGWISRTHIDEYGDERAGYVRPSGAMFIGHVDAEWLYLIPETTMQFLTSAAAAAGRHFPVEQRTLLRRLEEERLIAVQNGRHVVNQRIQGATRRVIKLKVDSLSLLLQGREQREHREQTASPDSHVPRERSRKSERSAAPGNSLWDHVDSNDHVVPADPAVPAAAEEGDREMVIL